MNAKSVKILGLITVLAVIGAAAVLFSNRGPAPFEGAGEKLFPGFSDQVAEAIRLELASGEENHQAS